MKKYAILLIGFIFLAGCSSVSIVPEISPTLYDRELLNLTGELTVKSIVKSNSGLVFIDQDGKICRYNLENEMEDFSYLPKRPVQPGFFHQGNYLVLKEQAPSSYIVFDLALMKEIAELKDLKLTKTLGVDQTRVIYLSGEDKPVLTVLNYRTGAFLKTIPLGEKETVYNGEWKGNKLFILSNEGIHIYDSGKNSADMITLKDKACSDFLLDNNQIYYGSEKRDLVQFSLGSMKARWKFKLGEVLDVAPRKIGAYIIVTPKDNNIYFFNKSGSLYWWEKLNSSLLLPPEPMKENAAVCLWNGSIKFFNYKNKKVITFPLELAFKSNPVCVGDYLYIVTEEKKPGVGGAEETVYRKLSKIGNYFGVIVKTFPEFGQTVGKSIRFDMKAVNLIDPVFDVQIINTRSKNPEFKIPKKINVHDKPSFIWVPQEEAVYHLIIGINAKNKENIIYEQDINVIDYNRIVRDYFYKIQTSCEIDSLK